MSTWVNEFGIILSVDDQGHIHRGKGEGGGQFTSKESSGKATMKDFMAAQKAIAVAAREGPHGGDWEAIKHILPDIKTPVFHTTKAAIQVMEEGFAPGKGSVFGGSKGGGNISSVSMSSNLDWTTKGQGAAFGRYVFIMDEEDLQKRGEIKDYQAPDTDDFEFERRFFGDEIPPSEIKGLVVTKHMGRMEKEEASEWPFPVIYKDNVNGWTLVPRKTTSRSTDEKGKNGGTVLLSSGEKVVGDERGVPPVRQGRDDARSVRKTYREASITMGQIPQLPTQSAQLVLWSSHIIGECLREAGGDVDAALSAASYILATQPIPEGFALSVDVQGHQHRSKGKGGGQFTSTSNGNGASKQKPDKRAAQEDYKKHGTKAKAFKSWFGDWEKGEGSKVVDEEGAPAEKHSMPGNGSMVRDKLTGKPYMVFHGTPKPGWDTFDIEKTGHPNSLVYGRGFYFASNAKQSEHYAGESGEVKRVYLNIRRPFDMNATVTREEFEELTGRKMGLWKRLSRYMNQAGELTGHDVFEALSKGSGKQDNGAATKRLQELGYDGITHTFGASGTQRGGDEKDRVWIAFQPNQIKSVDNVGTFDPDEASINLSEEFEEKHPRDEDGKFVGKYSQRTGKGAEYFFGEKVDTISYLTGGSPEKVLQRVKAVQSALTNREEIPVVTLPSSIIIIPTQSQLESDIKPFMEDKSGLPLFALRDGKYYILDGHHRTAAQLLQGNTIRAKVVDLENDTFLSADIPVFLAHDIHNPQAQGILNRTLKAAKGLSASARKDLTAALKKTDNGEAIVNFIAKYRLQLARLLTTTQLAAVLEGAREVAGKVPVLATFPGAVLPPPTLEPEEASALVDRLAQLSGQERAEAVYALPTEQQAYVWQAIAAKEASPPIRPPSFAPPKPRRGAPEDIHFPIIDEAVRELSEKNVIDRQRFDALDAAARAKAFTVANVAAEETLTKIRDSLAENVKEGADYETWKGKVLADVDAGTFMSDAHQETVFRTNVQSAFSDGQATVLAHPLVRSGFPYSAYDAIHDDRVRENHLALEKHGIGETNVYRTDDPVFQLFRPPWDYNDRCGWTPLTVRQAAERGIAEAQEWLRTGIEPTPKAFVAMPPFEPPPGFQRAVAAAPLSIQLSMQSMAAFGFDPNEKRDEQGRWTTGGNIKPTSLISRLLSVFGIGKNKGRKGVKLSKHNLRRKTAKIAKDILGQSVTAEQLALLTGAPDGSELEVLEVGTAKGGLVLKVSQAGVYEAERHLYRAGDQIVIENLEFHVEKDKQGQGLGASIFARQVADAAEFDVSHIKTYAVGNSMSKMNGYYTWPRLGYDGPLDDFKGRKYENKLPPEFGDANTVQELIRKPGGLEWWKENGSHIHLEFDLSPDSESRTILDAYLAAKSASSVKAMSLTNMSTDPDLSPEDEDALDRVWEVITSDDSTTLSIAMERQQLTAEILAALFGDDAVEVAEELCQADGDDGVALANGSPPKVKKRYGPRPGPNWRPGGVSRLGTQIWLWGAATVAPSPAHTTAPTPPVPPTPAPTPAVPPTPPAPTPTPPRPGGQKARLASIDAYNDAMAKLNAGQTLTAAEKAALARKLTNMPVGMLRSLHTALGGMVGPGRAPKAKDIVDSVKTILTGVTPAAPTPTAPTPRLGGWKTGLPQFDDAVADALAGKNLTQQQINDAANAARVAWQVRDHHIEQAILALGGTVTSTGGPVTISSLTTDLIATLRTKLAPPTPPPNWKFTRPPLATIAPAPVTPTVPKSMKEETWTTGKAQPGSLNGIDFKPAPPKFWANTPDKDLGEPPTPSRHTRASILIVEPDGRMWIVQPTNGFGGRKYTLPGGTVEPGLTDQQNALKETWEETGLQCEITGYLGDFDDANYGDAGNSTRTGRLYIGKRVGGAPWDAKIESHIIDHKTGKPSAESEKITLVPPERAAKLLHRTDDLAQLMTVLPPPFDTPVKGKGSEPLKKFFAAIQPKSEAYKKGGKKGDGDLHAVQEMRGFNGKPTVVSKNAMDTLVAQGGHIEVLRGLTDTWSSTGRVTADQLADQFRDGEHFPGYGCFGNGTYADGKKGSSNVANSQYSSSNVVRIAIPKTAKIIKQSELEKKVPKPPKGYTGSKTGGSYPDDEQWWGVQAAIAGYDAIEVDGNSRKHGGYGAPPRNNYYVILNRSILTVQKENAKGHIIK